MVVRTFRALRRGKSYPGKRMGFARNGLGCDNLPHVTAIISVDCVCQTCKNADWLMKG
jgi:hypothetical protein